MVAEQQQAWDNVFTSGSHLAQVATMMQELGTHYARLKQQYLMSTFEQTIRTNHLKNYYFSNILNVQTIDAISRAAQAAYGPSASFIELIQAFFHSQLRIQLAQTAETLHSTFQKLEGTRLSDFILQANELYKSYDIDDFEEIDFDEITLEPAEQELVKDTVNLFIEQPSNWQLKLDSRLKLCKEKNPILYRLLRFLIGSVIIPFLFLVWSSSSPANVTQNAPLRAEPTSTSTSITIIPQGTTVIIIGDAPYFYQVEYAYGDDEVYTGYIYKGLTKPTEDSNGEGEISDSKSP